MLDIGTLFVNVSTFFEAFLRTIVLRKASKNVQMLTKSVPMSNIACGIHLII